MGHVINMTATPCTEAFRNQADWKTKMSYSYTANVKSAPIELLCFLPTCLALDQYTYVRMCALDTRILIPHVYTFLAPYSYTYVCTRHSRLLTS